MGAAAVFAKTDKIKPFFDVVYNVILFLCKLLLVGTIFVTCWMVAGRYIPFIPSPMWTEEVILTLIAYTTMLSASLALRKSAHIRMIALDPYFPKPVLKTLDLVADIAIMYFAYIMLTQGWTFTMNIGARGFYVSMPNLSLTWRYLPVPLGGAFMMLFNIEVIYNHFKAFFIEEAPAKAEDSSDAADDSESDDAAENDTDTEENSETGNGSEKEGDE